MNFEFFNFTFSLTGLVCFGTLLLLFAYQLYYYLRYINGAMRYNKRPKNTDIAVQKPGVSVIICAKNEEDNLRNNLPAILEQDYPNYEVIVINDASDDETEMVLDKFKKEYAHLRTTFVPQNTKSISTKKLGLTLGIKAAKHDLLLFTDADCMPAGKDWVTLMMRNFDSKAEFVLGYGAYNEYPTLLNRLITYDTLFIGLQYIGMALAKKPYMGVGRNLAYRKETFFKQNGFASSLHLFSGDDDLLVNKAATNSNTRVEVSKDSVTWSEPKKSLSNWTYQKTRHLSVSDNYSSKSRMRLFMEPFTRGLFYAAFILSLVFGNIITMIATGVIFIARYFTQFFVINQASKHFGGRHYTFFILVADIFLPLQSLYIFIFRIPTRKKRDNIRWD